MPIPEKKNSEVNISQQTSRNFLTWVLLYFDEPAILKKESNYESNDNGKKWLWFAIIGSAY